MSIDVTALAIKVTSEGIREASNALGGLSTSAANSTKRIATFEAAMTKLNQAAKLSSAAMAEYATKLQQQVNMMAALNTNAKGAAVSSSQLAAAMALLATSLNNLSLQSASAAKSQNTHNASMKEAHGLARGLSGSLGALWVTYGNLTGMAVGLAIGMSLKSIVTIGKDVEATLEGIRVKGSESAESVDKMRTAVMELGKGVYGPQEVAKAFETLVLAGLSAEKALTGIKDALNLATIGGTSIEKSAYTIVQVGTAMGYAAENYNRIADVIAMTAASSMSSVESLSEAFKSGSVVGKLYGVTLVDIGTSLAALSNLGIQGSAAGTSLKNFYKELAGSSQKVKDTLKGMKLVPDDFKDAEGNYLGLLQITEKLAQGLGTLSLRQQRLALDNLANERGIKTAVEVLDLYRQKVDSATEAGEKHGNMLAKLRAKIEESYGFAAIGAAAMSLTVDAQFKSVANTLQTVLLGAFQKVSPEINTVATALKAAFNKPEFAMAIQALAKAAGELAVTLAENIPLIVAFVQGLLAIKGVQFVIGIIQSATVAFAGLRVAALALGASLGPIAIALMAAGAAYMYFSTERDKSNMSTSQQAAIKYSEDYANALDEEAKRLTTQLALMKEGTKARDAETEAIGRQQLALARAEGDKAKLEAETRLERASMNVTLDQIKISESIQKRGGMLTGAVREFKEAQANLAAVNAKVEASFNRVAAGQKAVWDASKAIEAERVKQAEASKPKQTGSGVVVGEKLDKAAIRDSLNAELLVIQGRIDAVKRDLRYTEEDLQSKYKQGLIGEIALIKAKEAAEISAAATTINLLNEKLSKTEGKENRKALTQEIANAIKAKSEVEMDAARRSTNAQAEYYAKLDSDIVKSQAQALELRGKYVDAYTLATQAKYDLETKHLIDNINEETDAVRKAQLESRLMSLVSTQDAGKQSAAVREAVNEYNLLHATIQNTIKGVQTASEGQGLAGMWEAATAATKAYKDSLAALKIAEDEIRAQGAGGSDKDRLKYQEALAKSKGLAETVRKMWDGVGEGITESLEKAFGQGGKAIGDLLKITKDYNNLENKSGSARIKAYGDAAGAAKGFFKEGTKGYKAMETAEKAFRLIELAGMAKSLAITIANAAAASTAWIPAVFMSFMATLGPWGMAAAGLAIAAVLGGAFGGGGGGAPMSAADRQASAGKGSVLGDEDAKSTSIANSLEIIQKNSGLGLAHSSDMVNSLHTLVNSIGNLSNLVVRGAGLKDGLTPGVNEAVAKWFGTRISVKDQGIKIGANTLGGIDDVGVNAQTYADVETKKKFLGITTSTKNSTVTGNLPQEVNDQFAKVIMGLADTITIAASGLGLGGDAFTEKLKSFVVDIGSISIKGLTGAEIDEQFQAIFSKLGDDMAKFAIDGLQQYQKVGEGYFETLARISNDLIQVKDVFAVLGQTLNVTGMNAVSVSQGLIKAAGTLEKLTDGTKFFVDNFLTDAEKLAPIAESVTKRLNELGMSELTSIELYKNKVKALDLTNEADQKMYAALIELAPAFKAVADSVKEVTNEVEIAKKQRELNIQLIEALGGATMALTMRREDELAALKKLSPALAETQKKIYEALDMAQKAAADKANLEQTYQRNKTNLEQAYQRESTALQGVIDKFKSFSDSLKKFKESLLTGSLSTLSPEDKYKLAKERFISTSTLAAGGDEKALAELQGISQEFLDASRGYNASTAAYTADFNLVQQALTESVAMADVQTLIAQAQLDVMTQTYQAILGIKDGIMSFKDAVALFNQPIVPTTPTTPSGGFPSANPSSGWLQETLNKVNNAAGLGDWKMIEAEAAMAFIQSASKNAVMGSHFNGLDSVPFDGYVAEMHKGERIQTAKAANASDENSEELVKLTKQLLDKISKMETHTEASNMQRGAVAVQQAEQIAELIEKTDALTRAVKNQ